MVFGILMVALVAIILIYYFYRQSADSGVNTFPDNFTPIEKKKHPELFACEVAAKVSHVGEEEE